MIDFTFFLSLKASHRKSQLAKLCPVNMQEKILLNLVRSATETSFGRDHSFSTIKSIEAYQAHVPLRSYEAHWEQYWKELFPVLDSCTWPGIIPYFPVSSGTSSGKTKYIPLTQRGLSSNTKAGLDLLCFHKQNRPSSKIFGGTCFFLGGSTDLVKEAPGIYSGDLSGISNSTLPLWARPWYFPPKNLALISNWEEKIETLARESLKADVRMLGGVPSWLLIFLEKTAAMLGKSRVRMTDIYPNLEMLVHGGVNFEPYRARFEEILEGSRAETREVYPASEGFIAVADRGYGEGLRLNTDHDLFFEFIPVEELGTEKPTRHWVKNIESGINYAIALTTPSGLWSYILGDTVKFIETKVPRLLITGRTSYMLSAFGEHLIGEEIEDAVSTSAEALGITIRDYSVGALFPQSPGELGRHLFIVECESDESSASLNSSKLATLIDEILCARNEDYQAHRAEGFGLALPEILFLKPGGFAAWMKKRGKLGGQHKVPRIITNEDLFKDLQGFSLDYNS